MVDNNLDLVDAALKGQPSYIADDLRSELYIKLCEIVIEYSGTEQYFRTYARNIMQSFIRDYIRCMNTDYSCNKKDIYILYETMEDDCIYSVEFNKWCSKQLNDQEKIILSRLYDGYTLEEIADYLSDSINNVENIWIEIYKKYQNNFATN